MTQRNDVLMVFRVPKQLKDDLETLAAKDHRTLSNYARLALTDLRDKELKTND